MQVSFMLLALHFHMRGRLLMHTTNTLILKVTAIMIDSKHSVRTSKADNVRNHDGYTTSLYNIPFVNSGFSARSLRLKLSEGSITLFYFCQSLIVVEFFAL